MTTPGADKKPLVIYHNNCMDGMAAGWAAWSYFKDRGGCDLHAASYGTPPPDRAMYRSTIFIVDFSYPRAVLKEMTRFNDVIIVLDHHKSAMGDLKGLPVPPDLDHYGRMRQGNEEVASLYAEFDMNRSGAGMAWDYFYPDQRRPILIDRIEDRDLWRFQSPDTRDIHAALASYPLHDFQWFDNMVHEIESDTDGGAYSRLIVEGEAIDRRHMQVVHDIIKSTQRWMKIGFSTVPVCNAPYAYASDIGNVMAKGAPFAATYVDSETGRHFSLRSTNEGEDVSMVAASYGGGGHRNAAGFTKPLGWEGEKNPLIDGGSTGGSTPINAEK